MNLFLRILPVCAIFLAVSGCSQSANYKTASEVTSAPMTMADSSGSESTRGLVAGKQSQSTNSAVGQAATGREIIYTATVRLAVDDFDSFPERLAGIALSAGGFIAETNVDRMQGTRRTGRWVVRVPGSKYQDFIREVSGLGVPESVQEKADDVTEQFVDLQARINSGRQLEAQIIKLLEQQNDKIENVLAVERELSRVRLEIEQQEGRMRFLKDQVSMSTITIHAGEQRTFVPEQAKSLSERISLEWQNAVQQARDFSEDALVWIVANGFVIVAWIVGLLIAWLLVFRRVWRGLKRQFHPIPGGNAASSHTN